MFDKRAFAKFFEEFEGGGAGSGNEFAVLDDGFDFGKVGGEIFDFVEVESGSVA